MRKLRKIQRGFGLLELMLSMVIVALLLIMATRYYQSAHRVQRVSEAVTGVNAIIGAANEYAISSGSYTSITDLSVLDDLLPGGATGEVGPWGLPYTITTPAASSFVLTVPTGTDAAGCTMLSNQLSNISGLTIAPTCTGTSTNIAVTVSK